MESTITTEQLIENGWVVDREDSMFPMSKTISEPSEDEDEEGTIEMVLHRMDGQPLFAVCLPDGALLNINPSSIEELNKFESLILGYMPNF